MYFVFHRSVIMDKILSYESSGTEESSEEDNSMDKEDIDFFKSVPSGKQTFTVINKEKTVHSTDTKKSLKACNGTTCDNSLPPASDFFSLTSLRPSNNGCDVDEMERIVGTPQGNVGIPSSNFWKDFVPV